MLSRRRLRTHVPDASLDGYAEDGENKSMADVVPVVNAEAMAESLARRQRRATIVAVHVAASAI